MRHRPTRNTPRSPKPVSNFLIWSAILITAVIGGAPLCLLVWSLFQVWGNEDVLSSQPIGVFIHMSAPAAWSGSVVIQTDQGFLPLHEVVAISTGTPLVLELRGSGRHYVCDRPRTLCVETSGEGFKPSPQGVRP
ncbi:MAG: hypothetical protein ACREXG_02870 [Polaromonas sp.]